MRLNCHYKLYVASVYESILIPTATLQFNSGTNNLVLKDRVHKISFSSDASHKWYPLATFSFVQLTTNLGGGSHNPLRYGKLLEQFTELRKARHLQLTVLL